MSAGLAAAGASQRHRSRRVPLKQVNTLTSLQAINDGVRFNVYASVSLPATPVLCVFCCDPEDIPFPKLKAGENLIHGKKKFFPCLPDVYAPTYQDGLNFAWLLPSSAGQCDPCWYVIAQFVGGFGLDWTSLPHKCPPIAPRAGTYYQAATSSYGIGPGMFPDPVVLSNLAAEQLTAALENRAIRPRSSIYILDVHYCAEGMGPLPPAPSLLAEIAQGNMPAPTPPDCFPFGNLGGYDILFYYDLFMPA